MASAIAVIFIFVLMALLMLFRLIPALLALPIMAVLIAMMGGVPAPEILSVVVSFGSARLALAMVTVFFGAMLGQLIKNTGVARTIVRYAAEFSGDNPIWVSAVLTVVTALMFTVLGGLGSVIMVATIILPVMLSIGVPSVAAASIFLIGLSLGGILNLANWQLYMSVLNLKQADILSFALPLCGVMLVVATVFLVIELRRDRLSSLWAVNLSEDKQKAAPKLSLLTPFVPLGLVLGFSMYNLIAKPQVPFEFPIIGAMFIGLIYGVATTFGDSSINTLTKSIIEGISASAPAIALLIGIGMLLNAVTHPVISSSIEPLVSFVLPGGRLGYVLLFSILAPLSLYRGPLNIWGLGSGIIGLMLVSGKLAPAAIMAAMLAVGQIQGVSDPTNTHNVWIANHLGISVHDILRKTLPYMWALAVIGLIVAGVMYF